ncbi:MAG: hypothetical protein JWR18_3303 [Segetibacter sp.]|nr:hypothetical protein [Segetibacter sp.]
MQPLNEDMDELFRRAGEEYPLNTDGADWNKVLQQLHHNAGGFPKTNQKKKDFKYLLLLLLLPIGFICGRYVGNDKNVTSVKSNKEPAVAAAPKNTTSNKVPAPVNSGVTVKNGNRAQGTEAPASQALESRVHNTVTAVANTRRRSIKNHKIKGDQANLNSRISSTSNSESGKAGNGIEAPRATSNSTTAGNNTTKPGVEVGDKDNVAATVPGKSEPIASPSPLQAPIAAIADSISENNKQPDQPNNQVSSKEINNKNQNSFRKSLSYSFVIGPDVSTVKAQKTSKVGYSLGVMLRYQFSKRFSVEAGAMWDRKNYYTDGRYMDTTMLTLPMHSIVKSAVGYCNMVEIPINVRYDFSIQQKHLWFLSGGVSSYLMNNEDYQIVYERYSQIYSKDYEYMKSTKDWFSIMNLSVGYQKALGKYTSFSIAPYVKVPLRGVGIGKLPISSTGIFLSVSRSLK